MTHGPGSASFGKRVRTSTAETGKLPSIDRQLSDLTKSRRLAGRFALWSITAVVISLGMIIAGSSGNYMDNQPNGRMIMLLSDIQFTEDLPLTRFRILSFDLFGIYSSRSVTLGSVFIGLWGCFLMALTWIRQKRVSALGIILIAGSAGLGMFSAANAGAPGEAAAAQRFTTATTIERELGITSPGPDTTDQWLRNIRQHAAATPVAARASAASQQVRSEVTAEDIRFADAVALEQARFIAAQYWAVKGDYEQAGAYLPLNLDHIIFHPESQVALAQRICWLSEVTGRPAAGEAIAEQLCRKARPWRAALAVSLAAKQVVQFGLPFFLACLLVFAGLGIQLSRIRFRISAAAV